MAYVDGYVLPVPTKNMQTYAKMAKGAGKVWMDKGALAYWECAGDAMTLPPEMAGMCGDFKTVIGHKNTETVVFAFVVYKNKAHRDKVNKAVMTHMKDNHGDEMCDPNKMPFDMKRMAYGGFKPIVALGEIG